MSSVTFAMLRVTYYPLALNSPGGFFYIIITCQLLRVKCTVITLQEYSQTCVNNIRHGLVPNCGTCQSSQYEHLFSRYLGIMTCGNPARLEVRCV
jgi:hypothetical protein